MTDRLRKILSLIIVAAMVFCWAGVAPGEAFADDGYPICYEYSVPLTDAVYDYLNEIYIEKYPALGLRFKYGTDSEKAEMQTLADQITEGITDKAEQAKAIIRWVRASIEYEYYPESPFPYDTLRTHKGNCTNYALLISQLMRLKGIPAVLVDGWRADMEAFSISDLRKTLKEGHAWVYVYLNGQWIMYDPLFSKDVGFTDRSWISRWYYPNAIEGVVMTFDGMNYSYANRGTGAIYYKGNFQYNDDGVVEGNYYFRNADLGNFNYSLNGISQNFTIRIQNKVGTHSAVIRMTGEKYSGTKTLKYKINPKGTTLKSLTAASKGFTVKWTKQATQTTGYQIQYSTSSTFKSGNKTITISKNTTVSKKVNKLKAKKKYYVRIRTYKTVSGTKYYSKWSAKMKVTTKA